MDPFEFAKNELVNDTLSTCNAFYDRFRQLTQPKNASPDHAQIQWTVNELKAHIDSALEELHDLEKAVASVEQNPSRFKISADELQDRRKFINDTKADLTKKRRHLDGYQERYEQKNSPSSPSFREESNQLLGNSFDNDSFSTPLYNGSSSRKDRYDLLDEEMNRENQDFIDQQMMRQREVMDRQDEDLDKVIDGTSRLKNLVLDIGDELDEHAIIIDDLQRDTEHTQSRLNRAQRKLDKLLRGAGGDKGKLICIVLLFIILGILVLLVAFA